MYIDGRNRVVGRHLRKKRKAKSMKQGGRSLPEKKKKDQFCRFLYESIRNGIFFGGTLNIYSIVRLKQEFFDRHQNHPEILGKPERPHLVLLLSLGELTFAIPFRTNAHKPKNSGVSHCYFFSSSSRIEKSSKGRVPALDFSKSLIIEDSDIDEPTKIDQNEFKELQDNHHLIEDKFKKYLQFYLTSVRTKSNLNLPAINYSTLQYFSKELEAIGEI